jgi:hypothetical protein
MKFFIKHTILLTLLFALSSTLIAQRFLGEVVGGMNLSQVDGDEVYGFKRVGGHVGLGVILPIKKKWDITLETVFSQKGAKEKDQYSYWSKDSTFSELDSTFIGFDSTLYTGSYNLRLNYVEIPIIAHFTDKERYTVGLGFSYGRLVSSEEIEHNGSINPYSDTVNFSKNDYSVLLDLQVRVWKRLKFNVRYSYSIVPIRERTFHDIFSQDQLSWTRKQYNNTLTFRLVYVINEKPPAKIDKSD